MRIFYLLLCLLLIACTDQPNKKVPAPIESEIIQIPDSLLGKDWEGNKILVGKINLAQLRVFTSSDWYKKRLCPVQSESIGLSRNQTLAERQESKSNHGNMVRRQST